MFFVSKELGASFTLDPEDRDRLLYCPLQQDGYYSVDYREYGDASDLCQGNEYCIMELNHIYSYLLNVVPTVAHVK